MTVISLEERLAKELAGRSAAPREEPTTSPRKTGETLAELGHMRGVADMAYVALSDLALHCHGRREDVAWGIASGAAEDMEDED